MTTGPLHTNSPAGNFDHVAQLEALYSIGRILATGARQRQMLAEVLDALDSELGLSRGMIMLLSPDGSELTLEIAHKGLPGRRGPFKYRLGEGITGRVLETGEPAIIPKISEEPLFLDRFGNRRQTIQTEISYICMPIMIGRKVVGTLSADREYRPDNDLQQDTRVLSIVAAMIANDVRSRRMAAIERQQLEEENLQLRSELQDQYRPENIIGNSNAMREVFRAIHQVAPSDTTVLVRGESGTGKELVAHAIHYSSPRSGGAFVKVNCAALSESLLESELFGHEKGAFTGAIESRKGRIEEADGGTLLLDEIGDFSPGVQVKLLRVLQERQFERVGSNRPIKADVRIIAATNRDLEAAVAAERFRQDLYYRINVFPIFLPPLRERRDDILLLADRFVEQYARKMGKDIRRISTPAINMMVAYHWPGNVRELENCIERAVLLSNDGVIHSYHLPPTLQTSDASGTIGDGTLKDRIDSFEREIITDALKRNNGNKRAAARDLGTTERIIGWKIDKLAVDWKHFRKGR